MSCVSEVPLPHRGAIEQHGNLRHRRADLEQGDHLPLAAAGHLRDDAGRGRARRIRFDVHHRGLQARCLGHGDAVLDLFAARGGEHHLDVVLRAGHGADDVEVQAHVIERERNVLAGLGFDLHFELFFRQAGGQHDLFRDDGGRRHAQRRMARAGAAFLEQAAHGVHDLVQVLDVAIGDRAARQRLDRAALHAQAILAGIGKFDQPHAGAADIEPHERWRGAAEQGLQVWHHRCIPRPAR
jgi:hypothetical protein